MKKIIFIIGMHRSGTSLLTKGLETLGVYLGENLMAGDVYNEKGYWEDLDFVNFNDHLLNQIGMKWHSLLPIDDKKLKCLLTKENIQKAENIVKKNLSKSDCIAFKDPRLTILFSFWKIVIEKIGIDPFYVIALRNPQAVAMSLIKRDGFELSNSLWLWFSYALQSAFYTNVSNSIYVEYDNIIDNTKLQIDRLASFLKLSPESTKIAIYSDSFVEKNLNNFNSDNSQKYITYGVPEIPKELYTIQHMIALDKSINESEYRSFLKYGINMLHDIDALLEKYVIDITNQKKLTEENDQRNKIYQNKLEVEILSIYNSKSWKITYPLRCMDSMFRNIANNEKNI